MEHQPGAGEVKVVIDESIIMTVSAAAKVEQGGLLRIPYYVHVE